MLQHVVRSTVIDAPIERVWAVLRDFNSHDQWHDVVEESRIEGDERSDQVGCVRSFTLKDGNRIREQLLTLSDTRAQEHLLHRRGDRAAAALRRHGHAEAGDRRRPHLLALGVDLRDAARPGARACARWWRRASTRPASRTCAGTCSTAATCAARGGAPMPTSAAAAGAARRSCAATAAPEVLQADDGEAAPPGAGEVRIRQRAIGVNFFDVYLRKGWIPAMLPLPGVPGMEAAGSVVDVGAERERPAARRPRRLPRPGRPAPTAACAPCRPTGSCACRPRSRTTWRRRRCSRASPPTILLRDLGRVRRRARGCWSTRRPAASACSSAPGRAGSARP